MTAPGGVERREMGIIAWREKEHGFGLWQVCVETARCYFKASGDGAGKNIK